VLEPDRPGLKVGQRLQLGFDALPGLRAGGTIRTISGASEARQEWGPGRYYVVDLDLADVGAAKLSPGMSVRVSSDDDGAAADVAHAAAPQPPRATGEVYTRSTAASSPPQIEARWRLTVTKLADDGKLVKKGDPIVSFDGGEIVKLLTAKRSELEEKKRTQEKLHLELAEKARTETLTVAEAHAEAIKAQRKASQPEAYVPGVEYKKLVIARRKAEEREAKSVERERIAADERNAEQRAADADVARLSADVARMQASLAQLNLTAPRDGTFLHAVQPWNNEKIEVGKQVWRGVSVGQIPDTATLAVRAALPERDLARVKRGDRVRITLEGGSGQTVPGHIEDIGISVHSKSRVEPVPVIDLNITLDGGSGSLKPGQPVQVDVVGAAARLSAS
jgi:multidrug resistance efflux pump